MTGPDVGRVQHLIDLRRYPEAWQAVQSLLVERPDDPDVLGLGAQARLGLKEPGAALWLADRLVAAAPDQEWGHRIRAVALAELDRPAEATHAADRAIRLAPLHWQTHARYAAVATDPRAWGDRDPWEAAREAVRLAPHEPSAHFTMGLVAARRQRPDVATRAYRQTLALDPTHAAARNNLMLLESGVRIRRSARDLAAALRDAPQDEVIRGNVDWLVARLVTAVYFATLAALVLAVALTRIGSGEGRPNAATVVLALVVPLALAAYVVLVGRAVPPGLRRYALGRLWRSRGLLYLQVMAVLALVAFLFVCTSADVAEESPGLITLFGFPAVLGVIITAARR